VLAEPHGHTCRHRRGDAAFPAECCDIGEMQFDKRAADIREGDLRGRAEPSERKASSSFAMLAVVGIQVEDLIEPASRIVG